MCGYNASVPGCRLITSMRPVRRGTNGGVTPLGFAASAGGGLFVGLAFWAAAIVSPTLSGGSATLHSEQWRLIPLGEFLCEQLHV